MAGAVQAMLSRRSFVKTGAPASASTRERR